VLRSHYCTERAFHAEAKLGENDRTVGVGGGGVVQRLGAEQSKGRKMIILNEER
jgi:hypothetical protein